MIQCTVIADDLTGANATGVRLTKTGFRTYSLLEPEAFKADMITECDCLVCSTDSRSIESALAYDKVFGAVKKLQTPTVKIYAKRIDSTLRGNLGAETDAMLDALGGGRTAMIVPAFPASNRVLVGGCLLVNGIPLHKTEAAVDPKNPVHTPFCAELFSAQSKYPVDSVAMSDLMKGPDFVAQKIQALAAKGVRNIVFDGVSDEDIALVAQSVVKSGVPFIAVDPGVFTAEVSRCMIPAVEKPSGKPKKQSRILVVVGSVNAVARGQVEHFLKNEKAGNVFMNTGEFMEDGHRREQEISRVAREIIAQKDSGGLLSIIGQGINPEHRVPFEPYAEKYGCTFDELSNRINQAIAEITCCIISADPDIRALYTCGGDITVAICHRLGSAALRLQDEVLPLASYAEMTGGEFPGLKIITKGGMVGPPDAISRCVTYLMEKLSGEQYE
jgi:uncharacterized protein YgbK (DUF1537 family)